MWQSWQAWPGSRLPSPGPVEAAGMPPRRRPAVRDAGPACAPRRTGSRAGLCPTGCRTARGAGSLALMRRAWQPARRRPAAPAPSGLPRAQACRKPDAAPHGLRVTSAGHHAMAGGGHQDDGFWSWSTGQGTGRWGHEVRGRVPVSSARTLAKGFWHAQGLDAILCQPAAHFLAGSTSGRRHPSGDGCRGCRVGSRPGIALRDGARGCWLGRDVA